MGYRTAAGKPCGQPGSIPAAAPSKRKNPLKMAYGKPRKGPYLLI